MLWFEGTPWELLRELEEDDRSEWSSSTNWFRFLHGTQWIHCLQHQSGKNKIYHPNGYEGLIPIKLTINYYIHISTHPLLPCSAKQIKTLNVVCFSKQITVFFRWKERIQNFLFSYRCWNQSIFEVCILIE